MSAEQVVLPNTCWESLAHTARWWQGRRRYDAATPGRERPSA
ncbi:hypothetical protein [Streptomyces sp. Wb2n-11]|nr:hypothetical protein [Streptomyces sp. Wb2n-11]